QVGLSREPGRGRTRPESDSRRASLPTSVRAQDAPAMARSSLAWRLLPLSTPVVPPRFDLEKGGPGPNICEDAPSGTRPLSSRQAWGSVGRRRPDRLPTGTGRRFLMGHEPQTKQVGVEELRAQIVTIMEELQLPAPQRMLSRIEKMLDEK